MGSKLLWPAALCLKESSWESNYRDVKGCQGGQQLPVVCRPLLGRCWSQPGGAVWAPHPHGGMGITEIVVLLSATQGLALYEEPDRICP